MDNMNSGMGDDFNTGPSSATGTSSGMGSRSEEFRVSGDRVVSKVREVINEGNVRRVILKNEEGNTLIEVPLTAGLAVGVAAAWLFPVWAAIGAIAALVAHLTIVVERTGDTPKDQM